MMFCHRFYMHQSHAKNDWQTSKPILSEEGKKLGLIDTIVPPQELLKVSRQWALDIAEKRRPWVRSLLGIDKIGSLSEAHEIIKVERQRAKLTTPNMPQHVAYLDVIEMRMMNQKSVIHNQATPLDLSKITEMRLAPSDPTQLDTLFEVFCECAVLNPEPVEGGHEFWQYAHPPQLPILATVLQGPAQMGASILSA